MSAALAPAQIYDESQLEAAIAAAYARLIAATDRDDKLTHWREMVRLMDRRSVHRLRFLKRLSEYELSPPSEPARIAQASAGCRGDAAGGVP